MPKRDGGPVRVPIPRAGRTSMCKQAELGALMDALVLESVTKAFDGVCAVEGLSARVPAGCIYGLLGPNGAGKTTALRMIMDIFRPDEGRIEVLGQRSVAEARGARALPARKGPGSPGLHGQPEGHGEGGGPIMRG